MNVTFAGQEVNVKRVETFPSRFKLNDFLVGPNGMLLKVVTVQRDCPYFENLNRSKTVVILETESGARVPINGMFGKYSILRRR